MNLVELEPAVAEKEHNLSADPTIKNDFSSVSSSGTVFYCSDGGRSDELQNLASSFL